MSICKDCIHYEICDKYVAPNESFPEVDGCKCFKDKADVFEVRHGEWKDVQRAYTTSRGGKGSSPYRSCSVCEWEYPVVTVGQHLKKYTYCPNCGAKMDGERREQNEG